jgi:hypothetical protein
MVVREVSWRPSVIHKLTDQMATCIGVCTVVHQAHLSRKGCCAIIDHLFIVAELNPVQASPWEQAIVDAEGRRV